jgi:hypothetical protein
MANLLVSELILTGTHASRKQSQSLEYFIDLFVGRVQQG